ncbi:MAG: RNA polymerase sigma factor, partial [Nitrososphaerota archaeon]
WQHIEESDTARRLPLEVLARCCRERLGAGAIDDAHRIFTVIMKQIRVHVGKWARSVASQARSPLDPEDLEQVCYMKLWEELKGDGPIFLLENFMHKLDLIFKHVAHSEMEKAGEWQRPGVETPKRIPRKQVDSLQAVPAGTEELPLSELVPDERAQDELERVNLSDLFELVMSLPPDERIIIRDWLNGDRTQEETAAELSVTARTIRNRLKKIRDELRARYEGGRGGENG